MDQTVAIVYVKYSISGIGVEVDVEGNVYVLELSVSCVGQVLLSVIDKG